MVVNKTRNLLPTRTTGITFSKSQARDAVHLIILVTDVMKWLTFEITQSTAETPVLARVGGVNSRINRPAISTKVRSFWAFMITFGLSVSFLTVRA